ncbi:unnamed protein product [Spirodela intermedia]|uniref:Uncharacterized protein n=1 Tax=Spirodela intermedia TaxID=51605 RepID=A0A7I8IL99_SPIIN|nr:unnamed protein product [Spirodela intermedia]CAA6657708.1 unnamed protein product [Spirodela intermedia]
MAGLRRAAPTASPCRSSVASSPDPGEVPAQAAVIVPSEAVLVPPVVNGGDPPGENEQEWRQRAQLVDAHPLLELHPLLNPLLAGLSVSPLRERHREDRVRPEGRGEIGREVGVAVLGRRQHCVGLRQPRGGESEDVVHQNNVGVEVDDPAGAAIAVGGEEAVEVGAGVVEGAVQGGADGGGDESGDAGAVEGVYSVRESTAEEATKWNCTDCGQAVWRSTERIAAMDPRSASGEQDASADGLSAAGQLGEL